MWVTIGARSRPKGLVGLLLECHERIRSFAALAEGIARSTDAPLDERREACSRCRRYFVEAFPLHVTDEEESLAPRLRGKDAEVDAALDAMQREHDEHEPLVARLIAALEHATASSWDEPTRTRLLHAAARAAKALDAHLAHEESVVFPKISLLLTLEEQTAIVTELRARRQ